MSQPQALIAIGLLLVTILPAADAKRDECDFTTGAGGNGANGRELQVKATHTGLGVDMVLCVLDERGHTVSLAFGGSEGLPGTITMPKTLKQGVYTAIVELTPRDGAASARTAIAVDLAACGDTTVAHTYSTYVPGALTVVGPRVTCEATP